MTHKHANKQSHFLSCLSQLKIKKLFFLDINEITEIEENDINDTLACDDDAHKVVLCTPGLFLRIIITNFTTKPFF